LANLRIQRAKKLLEETELKIYEVSSLVGYTDITHFSRVFERAVGIKPSEYRNSEKEYR
jgi:Transcriptional regulator containing an amidase domain and an AraC-type DNA-binding HTH domain